MRGGKHSLLIEAFESFSCFLYHRLKGRIGVLPQREEALVGLGGFLLAAQILQRLEEDTDLEEVERWLDWYWEGGLLSPAPAEFFGGGSGSPDAAYFTVEDVEPGQYAWVVWTSEGELSETFTVASPSSSSSR